MKILITGAAGYIGSHICVEILNRGDQIVLIDNLSNSKIDGLEKVANLTGKNLTIVGQENNLSLLIHDEMIFFNEDIRDKRVMSKIFSSFDISAVIHLAGYKSVGDSLINPLDYYDNNVIGSITLLNEMRKAKVRNIIFSSSASVYGNAKKLPIKEDFYADGGINPYAQSKFFIEKILKDWQASDSSLKVTILRYFNPVGAHESGLIGENLKDNPSNLMPFISQVASGRLEKLKIFGKDYPTRDGTGIRDYIHVVDLAKGHLSALDYLIEALPDTYIFNLGTGFGTTVLELIHTFEEVSGKLVPYEFVDKRLGDVAESWTSTELAKEKLGWTSKYGLKKMCEDTWRWQLKNSEGLKNVKNN